MENSIKNHHLLPIGTRVKRAVKMEKNPKSGTVVSYGKSGTYGPGQLTNVLWDGENYPAYGYYIFELKEINENEE